MDEYRLYLSGEPGGYYGFAGEPKVQVLEHGVIVYVGRMIHEPREIKVFVTPGSQAALQRIPKA